MVSFIWSLFTDLKADHEGEGSSNEVQQEMEEFSKTISVMSWLDGGHNGGKDTWITNPTILKVFLIFLIFLLVFS
jgi:hypothetical protein